MVSETFFTQQESPASSLDVSPDKKAVVIAGRQIFKIFSIDGHQFTELFNLRSVRNVNLNYSCNDVAWNPFDEAILATAATNGAVVIWNLGKPSKAKQADVYAEHKRTVNKVSFNPLDRNLLLSGSQDTAIKLFDLRVFSNSVSTFSANMESVRDVQFSPHNEYSFASVAENGRVSLWDTRKTDKWEKSWTGHAENAFACDWHPEIRHWLATAGRDKTVKIWRTEEKQSAMDTVIHTIGPIGKIKWRPGKKAQIASSAIALDFAINVWDIRRPFVPYGVFENHSDITTDIKWMGVDSDVILSSSRDKTLYHHSFANAVHPADRANPIGLSINISGEIGVACRRRDIASSTGGSLIDHQVCIPRAPPPPQYSLQPTQPLSYQSLTQQQQQPGSLTSPSGSIASSASMVQHQVRNPPPPSSGSSTNVQDKAPANPRHSLSQLDVFRRSSPEKRSNSTSTMARKLSLDIPEFLRKAKSKNDEGFKAAQSSLRIFKDENLSNGLDVMTSSEVTTSKSTKSNELFFGLEKLATKKQVKKTNKNVTNTDWFVLSAKNYILTGKSLNELCDHNAAVATGLNRTQIATSWTLMKMLNGFYNFDNALKTMLDNKPSSSPAEIGFDDHSPSPSRPYSPFQDNFDNLNLRSKAGSTQMQAISNMDGATKLKKRRDEKKKTNRKTLPRRFSGLELRATSSSPKNNVEAANQESGSTSEDENDLTLTNIATGPALGGNNSFYDFFGDHDMAHMGVEQYGAPDLSLLNRQGQELNMKAEAFEIRHELKETTDHEQATAEQMATGALQDDDANEKLEEPLQSVTVEDQANSLLRVSEVEIFPKWSSDPVVRKALVDFAEMGDIQTTVTMYLVLGHERLSHLFDQNIVEVWFQAYIELLQRFRLFNVAAQVIKLCPIEAVSTMSNVSTSYFSHCAKCGKALNSKEGGWYCTRCKKFPNLCVICHEIVRGLFVWCRHCGHGGHVDHMRYWFNNRKQCPSACGCVCKI